MYQPPTLSSCTTPSTARDLRQRISYCKFLLASWRWLLPVATTLALAADFEVRSLGHS